MDGIRDKEFIKYFYLKLQLYLIMYGFLYRHLKFLHYTSVFSLSALLLFFAVLLILFA